MNPIEYSQHMQIISPTNGTSQSVGPKSLLRSCASIPDVADFNIMNNSAFIDQIKYKAEIMSANFMNLENDNHDLTVNVSYHMLSNVPINLMPPPPHNPNMINNNNVVVNNFNRRGSWKSGNELRCNSPQSSESDESCRSFKHNRESPTNGVNYRGRFKNSGYTQNTMYNKFSNSSPNVFYPNGANQNHNHIKPKYYTNSSSQHHRNDKKNKFQTKSDINKRVYGLMERFTSRSSLFRIPSSQPGLYNMNEWDPLNRSIWDMYTSRAQKEEVYKMKLELWKKVYLSIQKILMQYGLFLVGSTMSGLSLDSSDIDMCLLVRPWVNDVRSNALSFLQNICHMLDSCDFVKSPEVISAKVPILKFRDANYGFEVDLNCNNSVGIRNTHLLNCYTRLDWRVRPLVIIVKLWAQSNDINDAKRMTISSYSIALMVIHFLQCGVTPPAIPCLQGMYPEKFNPDIEIHDIDIQEELKPFYSDNKQSIGELLLGFLQYYTFFDYNQFAISVREGALLTKEECRFTRSPKNDATQWKLLCIQEPFDLTNTARCVYDVETFEVIKDVFRRSYETLLKTKSLSSILPCNQR